MQILPWLLFIALIFLLLALDLGVLNKKAHVPSFKESLRMTGLWVGLALLFSVVVYFMYAGNWLGVNPGARDAATVVMEYLAGYIIEESLSLDNIFVIAMLFTFFKIPREFQHRILFWGILGAIVFRAFMILAGTALITRFEWTTYLFGALLIFAAVKMARADDNEEPKTDGFAMRLVQKFYPIHWSVEQDKFFVRLPDGRKAATTLFVALVIVEFTDILFAIDSIPAIFAVTTDPFIVFTSNIFAILGLRSLYFFLAGMINAFKYVKPSLVVVLLFVGCKMLAVHYYKVPTPISLAVILGILGTGVTASILANRKAKRLHAPQ